MDNDDAFKLGWKDGWASCMDFISLAIYDGYDGKALPRMIPNMEKSHPHPPPMKQDHPDLVRHND